MHTRTCAHARTNTQMHAHTHTDAHCYLHTYNIRTYVQTVTHFTQTEIPVSINTDKINPCQRTLSQYLNTHRYTQTHANTSAYINTRI